MYIIGRIFTFYIYFLFSEEEEDLKLIVFNEKFN